MKIQSLTLFTNSILTQKHFFEKVLNLPLGEEAEKAFSVMIGNGKLRFAEAHTPHLYHYCFLIPRNQLSAAHTWLAERVEVIADEQGQKVQYYEDWNAKSLYCYDGVGNLLEFIARFDIEQEASGAFDSSQILSINEIGMPTYDIAHTDQRLKSELGTAFWKGNYHRFGTHGDQEGLLLLVNPKVKKNWYPANLPIAFSPFQAVLKVRQELFALNYQNGQMKIEKI